uniref:Uncharacterized protein n=1 Tax=Xenopus tropicalis TaxID=8364 RepID=B4F6H5_XENTR|nr:Unknown (protein for MGC:135274) [Xenopus tropicalis]
MSFLLPKLSSKRDVDHAIKTTSEKVLVLRFGRDEDHVCLQLDDIVSVLILFIYLTLFVLCTVFYFIFLFFSAVQDIP